MTLSEILKIPGAEEVLGKHNFPCVSCPYAKMEMEKLELGNVCGKYGIDVEGLIKDLEKVYNK